MSERHFCSLSAKEQAVALGIDTSSFDKRIKDLKLEYTIINRAISAFGEIAAVEECLPVNIDALKASRKTVADKLNKTYLDNKAANESIRAKHKSDCDKIRDENEAVSKSDSDYRVLWNDIGDTVSKIKRLGYTGTDLFKWFDGLNKPGQTEPKPEPELIGIVNELPDDAELKSIDAQIEAAYETNAKAEKYQAFVKKVADKAAKVKELEENKKLQDEESAARIEYIKQFDFGFSGLTTNDSGELQLNERPIKDPYFSTGERIKIVARLMRSRSPLFRTVFLDSACELDPGNLKKLLDELVDDGFHPIVSIPNEKPIDGENCIVLRECKILTSGEAEKPSIL